MRLGSVIDKPADIPLFVGICCSVPTYCLILYCTEGNPPTAFGLSATEPLLVLFSDGIN